MWTVIYWDGWDLSASSRARDGCGEGGASGCMVAEESEESKIGGVVSELGGVNWGEAVVIARERTYGEREVGAAARSGGECAARGRGRKRWIARTSIAGIFLTAFDSPASLAQLFNVPRQEPILPG